ncbi:transmembrane protein 182-like [Leuresthes tenuis]|uniref:transmembrane protein 182-like n=1 Tax=Leuresthes tenuis TaxID=355514 RepID=UPI003B50D4A3
MSPADRLKVLLFLALFFGAAGFLFMLLSCGTEYWLLAAESCDGGSDSKQHVKDVKIFHEGLFWRCSYVAASDDYSIWDIWISNQPLSKVCHAAFLFPFPAHEPVWGKPDSVPSEPYEHPSAIVFRTFWSIFLTTGVMAVVIGGFFVICAAPLTNHKLYRVGGALHICGGLCLLVVMVMYLMWVQVLDTLEQFVHRKASSCPSFHLSIQHGPSFLLAPVAVFFCLLAGLLFVLMGESVQGMELDQTDKTPERSASEL